jgi:uncharacterized small protein (TIGR04563 family)
MRFLRPNASKFARLRAAAVGSATPSPFGFPIGYTGAKSGSDKRKQSLYFPEEMLKEIGAEAVRQDRSLSWIVQKAWKVARKDIMSIPSLDADSIPGAPRKPDGS